MSLEDVAVVEYRSDCYCSRLRALRPGNFVDNPFTPCPGAFH